MKEQSKAEKFLKEKGVTGSDFMETGMPGYISELMQEYSNQENKELKEEINKLLKSHSDWMSLAIERKEENERFKENEIKLRDALSECVLIIKEVNPRLALKIVADVLK
jgi:hypothetical protein